MSQHPATIAEFEAEMQTVHDMLVAAAEELGSPLGDLVRAQVKRAAPMVRAALVLTVAVPPGETIPAAGREQRILLAAALEMLYVALNVHRMLVTASMRQNPSSDDPLDRSFVGSTILAGDYCFSRAAQMAARTDHPRVVAIFAQALQNVSEGLLRSRFGSITEDEPVTTVNAESVHFEFDETRELLRSGAYAAAALVGLADANTQEAATLSQEIWARWAGKGARTGSQDSPAAGHRPLPTYGRWPILAQWLNRSRANGKVPPPPINRTLFN